MAFEVGQRVGDYEVVKMLGVGGMGHVYLVRNIISNRTEAMKVLLPDLTAERDLAMRFISEIRTLATFDHPNIAQLRTAFQANNQLIMIMEFVEGSTLEQLAHSHPIAVPSVADYISQSLSALGFAHSHGVVHRDIKPANLMVTSHGIVKLMDFGIAKSTTEDLQQTRPGTTIGSLHYMSPEQVRGGTIDARSDLYSVGVVLYELTAGRRPFEADTTFGILNQQLNVVPTPPIEHNPQLPSGLNQIIVKALAKDPADRFQTAEDFRAALKAFRPAPAPSNATVLMPTAPAPSIAQAPIAAAAAATAATLIMDPAAPPAFAPVPNTAPPAAYNNAAYAPPAPAQMPYPMPAQPMRPAPRSGGHRGLWIATGALVVLLVLVGIGFALPHFVSTFASSRSAAADKANTTQPVTQEAAPTQQTTTTPDAGTANPTSAPASQPAANATASVPYSNGSSSAPHSAGLSPQNAGPSRTSNPNQSVASASEPPPPPANNAAALEAADERLMQMQARANAAHHSIATIRSQNEASGYGLRGDIDAADSRLSSYLNAANNALSRSDAAAAQRALDKAEPDLATVEKFLGH